MVVSVGAGKVASMTARSFVAAALRMACCRSYRDKNSREVATGLLQRTAEDPVVPDLAFIVFAATAAGGHPSDRAAPDGHCDEPYCIC